MQLTWKVTSSLRTFNEAAYTPATLSLIMRAMKRARVLKASELPSKASMLPAVMPVATLCNPAKHASQYSLWFRLGWKAYQLCCRL